MTTGTVITAVDSDTGTSFSDMLVADEAGTAPNIIRAVEHNGTTYTLNATDDGIDITGPSGDFIGFNTGTGETGALLLDGTMLLSAQPITQLSAAAGWTLHSGKP